MNTKKKWMQLIGVAVLVALASVFTTGLVAADTPPMNADQVRQARLAQYREAVKQMERDHDWERFMQQTTAFEPTTQKPSTTAPLYAAALKQVEQDHNWERFTQYITASESTEQASSTSAPTSGFSEQTFIDQYLEALGSGEQVHNEYTVNSGEYFEPYLAAAVQSGSAHNAAPVRTTNYRTAEMYITTLKQVELDHNWDRFEQFLTR